MTSPPGDPLARPTFAALRWGCLCGVLVVSACGDTSDRQRRGARGGPKSMDPMSMAVLPRRRAVDGAVARYLSDLRKAAGALGRCRVNRSGIDRRCAEGRAFREVLERRGRLRAADQQRVGRVIQALAFDQVQSGEPALRLWAARQLLTTVHRDDRVLPRLLARARQEKHPVVLVELLAGVVSGWRRGAVYRDFVIFAASHPAAAMRRVAMRGLGEMQGNVQALRLLIERMERDPDPVVRGAACRFAGQHGEDRLVPVYRRVMVRVGRRPALYGACLEGLMEMWNPLQSWTRRRLSRRAFGLTLWALRRRPPSASHPSPMVLKGLGRVPSQAAAVGTRDPPWYRKADVVAILVSVALAPKAPRLRRGQAIAALAGLGAGKALGRIIARLGSGTDADSRYLTAMARKRLPRKR